MAIPEYKIAVQAIVGVVYNGAANCEVIHSFAGGDVDAFFDDVDLACLITVTARTRGEICEVIRNLNGGAMINHLMGIGVNVDCYRIGVRAICCPVIYLKGKAGICVAIFIARWLKTKTACINHCLCEGSTSRYILPVRPVISKSQHAIGRQAFDRNPA